MRTRKIFTYLALLLLIFFSDSSAQFERDSSLFTLGNYRTRLLLSAFDKQLNTYTFNSGFQHYFESEKFFIGLKENFNSTVIKSSSKNIKDEQYLWLLSEYKLSPAFSLGMLVNNNIYSDDRQLAINKASVLNSSLYLKFIPLEKITITPYGGFSNNKQIGESDNGFIYGSELNIESLRLSDFELNSVMKFQNEDISPRKNTSRFAGATIKSDIEQSLSNSISANYYEQRKDFYFAADSLTRMQFDINNNIQSRTESNYILQDRVVINPESSPFLMDFQGRVSWRDIDRNTRYITSGISNSGTFDTKIQEFRLDFASSTEYRTRDFNSVLKITFSEREEKHNLKKNESMNTVLFNEREKIEAEKNNISQLATISLASGILLSSNDRLSFSLFHRKLKYDTPSDFNFDDRDELLSIGRILYQRRINSLLDLYLSLEGSYNKIVYIFSERSSNNNVKSILKLSSGGIYSGKNIRSSNSAEVSANYTVFDYEDLNPIFKSFSFRQFVYRDSTLINFSKHIGMFLTGYVKLSEQGDFRWNSFSGRPVRYLNERYLEPKLFYLIQPFSLGIGIRYFSLSTYSYDQNNEKVLVSNYRSIGPATEIIAEIIERLSFRLYGWYEFINSENNISRESANLNFKVYWNF